MNFRTTNKPLGILAACVAAFSTMLAPITVNAALAVQVGQAPQMTQAFDNGSKMEVRSGPGGALGGTSVRFESSTGETLESKILQIGSGLYRLEIDEAVSVEFSLRLENGVARFGIPKLRVFNEVIAINPGALVEQRTERKLERAQSILTARYSKTLMDELAQAGAALSAANSKHGASAQTGDLGLVTGELRSRESLHCAATVVQYGGSFISLALCATMVLCVLAIMFHLGSAASAAATCTGWLLNERYDNCVEAGGDPEVCEAEIPGNNDTDT